LEECFNLAAPAPAASTIVSRIVEVAMARSKPKASRPAAPTPALPPQLAAANLHAAGIDIGAEAHFVAVPPSDDPQPVRGFGAYTADLEALADWLATCGITTIAMESTGVYWIPLFELLETRGCEVLLVDPQQVQKIKGRPTSDVHDCQWIQRLHTFGLLASAFRPTDQVCVLRSYLRQRAMLLTYAAQHIQHMQKALTQMNIKLQHVISDITGATGLAILRAILGGERDPEKLAQLRDYRCKHDEATIARALQGNWRDEQLFALAQAVALYEVYHQKITECDRQIETYLQTFADRREGQPLPPAPRPRKRGRNQPAFAVREPLHRMTGVDLTQIEGIDETTSLVILSEIGLEMTRWPTVKHFTSWLGLCPHHRVSGGKVLSRRTKPCANRAATALRLAAACLHHRQSALGAFFRRMKARLGAPKAITATAHKLARLVYSMLKHGTAYVRQGMDEYEQQFRDRMVQNMTRRAKALGYTLVKAPEGVAV
jgi:transposase